MITLLLCMLCSINSAIAASDAIDPKAPDTKTCNFCKPNNTPPFPAEKNFIDEEIAAGTMPKKWAMRYDAKRKKYYIPDYARDKQGEWYCVEDLQSKKCKSRVKRSKSETVVKEQTTAEQTTAAATLFVKSNSKSKKDSKRKR